MSAGLDVADVVQVNINLAPTAVPTRNFGALAIIGPSTVIDPVSRIRNYSNLDGVASDFGTSAPEYLAADLFFSQSPQPSILYIGRWANGPTAGQLNGAVFGQTQQAALLTTLEGVSAGGMTITVDGTSHTLSNLNFSGISNLNGAASVIQTGLASAATVVWNATEGQFIITSNTTGVNSAVSYATDPGTGTKLATDLGLTQASGASSPVAGTAGETPLAAAQAVCAANSDIYGVMFAEDAASGSPISDTQFLAVAAYIEGASPTRILGITVMEPGAVDPTSTTDLGSLLSAAGYGRTFWQYSSSSPYAVASIFGRAFTTNFNANNSMITLKFKTEPGVIPETITETQASAIDAKHGNVFVNYNNGAAIIQQGVMSNGTFFDERQGTDWLQNAVQTALFNLLYTSPSKIPQTDPGINQLVTVAEAALDQGVTNGLIAPGIWSSSLQFGSLTTGRALTKGYYVYAPPVASQSQADREARKAPALQCAIKLAGAVHSANLAINVNR